MFNFDLFYLIEDAQHATVFWVSGDLEQVKSRSECLDCAFVKSDPNHDTLVEFREGLLKKIGATRIF